MIDTVALREKVLDLAIRGKLVPQDPNDEPASVLLERIRAQKQQMVKDGKLKPKDIKDDTIIFVGDDNLHYEKFADGTVKCIEDEIPFEIPDSWAWARLGTVAEAIGDGDHQPPPQTHSGIPFLVISNVSDGKLSFSKTRYVSKEYYDTLPQSRKPRNGDLLFTVTGSYGIPVLVDTEIQFCFQRHIAIIHPCIITSHYLYAVLGSSYIKSICDDKATGVAQKTVSLATLRDMLIPVAPLSEQASISIQAESLLQIIEGITSDQKELQETTASVKTRILDLAVRGKLVPQDPNDEPASVLLERIRAEKEELIKQGKIKRDKKETVIFKGEDNSYYEKMGEKVICIDEELPFDVPESWSWSRFRNIVLNYDSQRRPITKHNRVNDLGLYDYYGATGAIDKVDSYIFDGEYLMIGEDGGNFFTQRDNSFIAAGRFWANNHVHIVQPIACDIWYLKHFLDSCDLAIMGLITGIGVPKLNQENMNKILVPIPPIAEQDRIAIAIKEIYSAIWNIEKSLS